MFRIGWLSNTPNEPLTCASLETLRAAMLRKVMFKAQISSGKLTWTLLPLAETSTAPSTVVVFKLTSCRAPLLTTVKLDTDSKLRPARVVKPVFSMSTAVVFVMPVVNWNCCRLGKPVHVISRVTYCSDGKLSCDKIWLPLRMKLPPIVCSWSPDNELI